MPDDTEKEVERIKKAFRRCFAADAGSVVLEHLKKSFVMATSHVKGDPYESAFREGRRALVLEIMSLAESKE